MRYVIVDIDGTISKVGDRVKCLECTTPDWDQFYDRCEEDEPIESIIELSNRLSQNYQIVLCTGRRESVREKTYNWLIDYGVFWSYLLMRKNGDFRHDTIIKPELLHEAKIPLDKIAYVLEDRNSMVKKWREIGLTCLQVAEGDF